MPFSPAIRLTILRKEREEKGGRRETMRSSSQIEDLIKFTLSQSKMKFKLNIFLSKENMDQSQDFLVLGFI